MVTFFKIELLKKFMVLPHVKTELEITFNDVYVKATAHLHHTFFNCTAEGLHHRENMMSSTFGNLKMKLEEEAQRIFITGKRHHQKKEINAVKRDMIAKFKKEFVHTE